MLQRLEHLHAVSADAIFAAKPLIAGHILHPLDQFKFVDRSIVHILNMHMSFSPFVK